MPQVVESFLRTQLLERRERLQDAVARADHAPKLHHLLGEVDAALARMEDGCYGICERCHTAIEGERLLADPLLRFCLCELSESERNALEQDLQLAARVQRGLLPPQDVAGQGWQACYHYEPAGLVSGDYCDVIDAHDGGLYFMVGDVSGKGVAASMLTAHLHAMFRALISVNLPLPAMLKHANRVFGASKLPSQYATLVCGRALSDGKVEISNAGHPPPLLLANGEVIPLRATSLPLGMFDTEEFSFCELELKSGDNLLIYSDGVSEAMDAFGSEYGVDRICNAIDHHRCSMPSKIIAACREDLATFRGHEARNDDVTLFVLGRA